MRYFKKISGFLSAALAVSSPLNQNFNLPVKAAIVADDIKESTKTMYDSFKGDTDKAYILKALNLQDPFMFLGSGVAEGIRFFDGNKNKLAFDARGKWQFNKDNAEGSVNFFRNLFPSSSGNLSEIGGNPNEHCFSRDLGEEVTAELVAKIASICHKYRYNNDFKRNFMEILGFLREKSGSKINFTRIDPIYSKQCKLILDEETFKIIPGIKEKFENEIKRRALRSANNLEKIFRNFSENGYKLAEDEKKSIKTLIGEDEKIFKLKSFGKQLLKILELNNKDLSKNTISDSLLSKIIKTEEVFSNSKLLTLEDDEKSILNQLRCLQGIRKIDDAKLKLDLLQPDCLKGCLNCLENFIELKNNISKEELSFPTKITDFLTKEGFSEEITNNESKYLTLFNAIVNMLLTIDQETAKDSDAPALPQYTAEHILMAYFSIKFKKEEIGRFYVSASDLIKLQSPVLDANLDRDLEETKNNLEKTSMVISAFSKLSLSPYGRPLCEVGHAYPVKYFQKDNKYDFCFEGDFQDCVETSLRHVLNLLFYSRNKNFDILKDCDEDNAQLKNATDRLNSGKNGGEALTYLPFKQRIKMFFKYQQNRVDTDDIVLRSMWNFVVSNMVEATNEKELYSLSYTSKLQSNNEVRADILNFLKFIYNTAISFKNELGLSDGKQLILAKEKIDHLIDFTAKQQPNAGEESKTLTETESNEIAETVQTVFSLINDKVEVERLNDFKFYPPSKGILGKFKTTIKDGKANEKVSFETRVINYHACVSLGDDSSGCQVTRELYDAAFTNKSKLTFFYYKKKVVGSIFPGLPRPSDDVELFYSGLSFFSNFGSYDKNKYFHTSRFLRDFFKLEEQGYADFNFDLIFKILGNHESVSNYNIIDRKILLLKIKEAYTKNARLRDELSKRLPLNYYANQISEEKIEEITSGDIPLWKIDSNFFSGKTSVTSCYFPKAVNKEILIGRNAFKSSGTEKIIFPNEVEKIKIESCAFSQCPKLKIVAIPASMKEISNGSFKRINEIELGERCFQKCENLQTLEIPVLVKKIPAGCCDGCTNLKVVLLPETLEIIGDNSFKDCVNLEKICIPESVKKIGAKCFFGCKMLKTVELPGNFDPTNFGSDCFEDCSNIEQIGSFTITKVQQPGSLYFAVVVHPKS